MIYKIFYLIFEILHELILKNENYSINLDRKLSKLYSMIEELNQDADEVLNNG